MQNLTKLLERCRTYRIPELYKWCYCTISAEILGDRSSCPQGNWTFLDLSLCKDKYVVINQRQVWCSIYCEKTKAFILEFWRSSCASSHKFIPEWPIFRALASLGFFLDVFLAVLMTSRKLRRLLNYIKMIPIFVCFQVTSKVRKYDIERNEKP